MLGDWARLTVYQNQCGDFIVGDDIFIDCLAKIQHWQHHEHPEWMNMVFVGQNDPSNQSTYAHLLNSGQTPPAVTEPLSYLKLTQYQDSIYHTPNPRNESVISLLDQGPKAVYLSGTPSLFCGENTAPDLAIVKTDFDGRRALNRGDEWIYELTIKNLTRNAQSNINILEKPISGNFDILSVEPSNGTFEFSWSPNLNESGEQTGNYNINIASIGPFQERKLKVKVKHHENSCEAITNAASIVGYSNFSQDRNTENNTSEITTTLDDVSNIQIFSEVLSVDEEAGTARIKLTAKNLGGFQPLVIIDDQITFGGAQLEPNTMREMILVDTRSETYSSESGLVIWTIKNLQAGSERELEIEVNIGSRDISEIRHDYEIKKPRLDCNELNQKGVIVIPFDREVEVKQVDVEVTKTVVGNRSYNLGETVLFDIKVKNNSQDTPATNVEIKDVINVEQNEAVSGWNFISESASSGSLNDNKWVLSTLSPGQEESIQVEVFTHQNTCAESLTNTALVESLSEVDFNSENNTSQAVVNLTGQVDLVPTYEILEIDHAMRKAKVKISVDNNSTVDFSNLEIAVNVPRNVNVISSTASNGQFANERWTISTLRNQTKAELTLSLEVDPASTMTEYEVKVKIQRTTPRECNADNNKETIKVSLVPAEVNLQIEKTSNMEIIRPGEQFMYFIKVKNLSLTTAATNLYVTDLVPAELTIDNIFPIHGVGRRLNPNLNEIKWEVPTVMPGETVELFFKVTPDTSLAQSCYYEIVNEAKIISVDQQNNSRQTKDEAKVHFYSDKGIELSFEQLESEEGTVILELSATAAAGTNYDRVDVALTIPSNLEVIEATPSLMQNNRIWRIGSLNGDETKKLRLKFKSKSADQSNYRVSALVDMVKGDLHCLEKDAIAEFELDYTGGNSGYDIQIEKLVDNTQPKPEDEITYTIYVRNLGDQIARKIKVVDEIPAGLTLVDASSATGVVDSDRSNNKVTWTLENVDLAANNWLYTLSIKVKVNPNCETSVINKAVLDDILGQDLNADNNQDSVEITVSRSNNANTFTNGNIAQLNRSLTTGMTVFPNPTTRGGELNITLTSLNSSQEQQFLNFRLFSSSGQMVAQEQKNVNFGETVSLQGMTNNLSSGFYSLTVTDTKGEIIAAKKVTIQNE